METPSNEGMQWIDAEKLREEELLEMMGSSCGKDMNARFMRRSSSATPLYEIGNFLDQKKGEVMEPQLVIGTKDKLEAI